MTVSTNTNKVSYAGNGSTTPFALGAGFIFFDSSELQVYLRVDSTGVSTLQTITTHYTVAGGAGATGTVTMLTAPAIGETLTIQRVMPLTQTADLVNNDTQDSEVVEDMVDKNTLGLQQLDESLFRTLRSPVDESADMEIPAAVTRAGKLLYFADDTDAQPTAVDATVDGLTILNSWITAVNNQALTAAADKLAYSTGSTTGALATITAFARTLLDDADQATAQATLITGGEANALVLLGLIHTALTDALKMPGGTTGERPGSPAFGDTRKNTTLSKLEWYNGGSWAGLGGATGGGADAAFYENDKASSGSGDGDYTITTDKNAMTAGPFTVTSGDTITVPAGSTWTIVGG